MGFKFIGGNRVNDGGGKNPVQKMLADFQGGNYRYNNQDWPDLVTMAKSASGNFTRASQGTGWRTVPVFAANEARVSDGLWVYEPSIANVTIRSQDFDDASAWTKAANTTITDGVSNPKGDPLAQRFETTTDTGGVTNAIDLTLTFRRWYAVSCAAKANGPAFLTLGMDGAQFDLVGDVGVTFDLADGSVVSDTTAGNAILKSSYDCGGGFWRCMFAYTPLHSGNYHVFARSGKNVAQSMDVWAFQREWIQPSQFPTPPLRAASSYMPTLDASATRAAETFITPTLSGNNDLMLTFDDGSVQTIHNVTGNYTLTTASVDRPWIRRMEAFEA